MGLHVSADARGQWMTAAVDLGSGPVFVRAGHRRG